MMIQELPNSTGTQLPLGPAISRSAVKVDGMRELDAQLVAAWSHAALVPGRGGDRAAAWCAAARAVARVSGCPEDLVALSHRIGAAPLAMRWQRGRAEPIHCVLSVAHAGGRAIVVAGASGRRLGVDLERAGTVAADEQRLFAHRAERAFGIDPTTLWTLKEAAWKAFSCGDQLPFHALAVAAYAAAPGTPTYIVFDVNGDIVPASAYIWQPWPGWVASVVEVA